MICYVLVLYAHISTTLFPQRRNLLTFTTSMVHSILCYITLYYIYFTLTVSDILYLYVCLGCMILRIICFNC